MESLGWKTGNWKAGYRVSLPALSPEEAALVLDSAKRFTEQTQRKEIGSKEEAAGLIERILASECAEQGFEIDEEQKQYLSRAVYLQTVGAGFLDELLADQSLEEIAAIGLGRPVYVYVRKQGWKRTNVSIESIDYFVSLANKLGRGLGRRLTAQQPRMNTVLEDGSRLHASMPPISNCELTIRKFGKEPLSPFDLLSLGTYDAKALSLLSLSIQADLSVLVCGNTASGKTSTLNALLSFVPASERMLLIEETPELSLLHPHQMRLVPFEEAQIGMVELVRDSLRMRPDRVVVGEIRGAEETRAFVESALCGQAKGCYSTFHAQSSRDALLRMRMMGCLEADLEGIDLFIVQRRVSSYDALRRRVGEKRKVTEVAVSRGDDALHPALAFNGKAFSQGALSLLIAKIAAGTDMREGEVRRELARRERMIGSWRNVKGFEKAFLHIQKWLFGSEV
ncbi:Type II/IV secretion system protein [uncultured archaeon]|nr:Type II/IV secretion system protein [uncultured archaeon]